MLKHHYQPPSPITLPPFSMISIIVRIIILLVTWLQCTHIQAVFLCPELLRALFNLRSWIDLVTNRATWRMPIKYSIHVYCTVHPCYVSSYSTHNSCVYSRVYYNIMLCAVLIFSSLTVILDLRYIDAIHSQPDRLPRFKATLVVYSTLQSNSNHFRYWL